MPDLVTLPALVVRHKSQNFMQVGEPPALDNKGSPKLFPVTEQDAWNFDIEHNLPVKVVLMGGAYRIVSRRGNKKYVNI